MPDYQNGKIYKIVNYENDNVYIGSTCEPTLARRLAKHVADYKRYLSGKKNYITSFKVIETGNYDIQLIEAYPCKNKMELHAREGHWIKQMDCINKIVAGRKHKESYKAYYEVNKEKIAKAHKTYREQNKVMIANANKAYREQNKEKLCAKRQCICGAIYSHTNKARHVKSNKHQSYFNSIDFLQDVHKMVISIINKYK
jgi:hypothetical protein